MRLQSLPRRRKMPRESSGMPESSGGVRKKHMSRKVVIFHNNPKAVSEFSDTAFFSENPLTRSA